MTIEPKLFILGLVILCMVILIMPNQVYAANTATVTTLQELQTALADDTVTAIELKNTIEINDSVTIDGKSKTITTSEKKAFTIHSGKVEFKDVTIINSAAAGRCIDIREAGVTLTLTRATLKTTSTGNNQTLTVGGSYNTPTTINIVKSTIEAGKAGYAIITFNPVKLTINNSNIKAYGALYMKDNGDNYGSAGSIVTIKNRSVLTGENNNNGPSDAFGTIVLEDGNISINVIDSKVEARGTSTAGQVVFGEASSVQNATKGNTVSISGNSEIISRKEEELTGLANDSTKVTLAVGVTSNVNIHEENREAGTVSKEINGEYVVGKENNINVVINNTTSGTVTASVQTAIKGETITLTVTPAEGYVLKNLTVNGTAITDNKFVMPDEEATVTAEFVASSGEATAELDKGEKDESPKMGIEETMIVISAVIAITSLFGLILLKRLNKK